MRWRRITIGLAIAAATACTRGRTCAQTRSSTLPSATAVIRDSGGPSGPTAPPPDTSGAAARQSPSPFMAVMGDFLREKGKEVAEQDQVVFLLPDPMSGTPTPTSAPVFMALTLAADQGFGAGTWSLFAVVGKDVRSLGTIESPNMSRVRLFRAKQGAVIFRRFWFQIADPTPEETYKGTFDDIELTASGLRTLSEELPVDLHSKRGLTLWNVPTGNKYLCDVRSFRSTGSCKLEAFSE